MRAFACLALLLAFPACTRTVGERCEVSGDGFTRRDPCEETCVNWAITCDGGHAVTPDECAGTLCARDADCGEGLICQQIDSVPANSRCMRAVVCQPPEDG